MKSFLVNKQVWLFEFQVKFVLDFVMRNEQWVTEVEFELYLHLFPTQDINSIIKQFLSNFIMQIYTDVK